ncbi:MAG: hypothetical protein V1808_03935 [Candidatus Daviesbacteria bacterium]
MSAEIKVAFENRLVSPEPEQKVVVETQNRESVDTSDSNIAKTLENGILYQEKEYFIATGEKLDKDL